MGVTLTIVALLFSIVLILVNKFIKIEKAPTKIQVVVPRKTTGGNSKNDSVVMKSFSLPINP